MHLKCCGKGRKTSTPSLALMFGLGSDLSAQRITYLRNKAGLMNTTGLSVSQTLLYCLGSSHSHLV